MRCYRLIVHLECFQMGLSYVHVATHVCVYIYCTRVCSTFQRARQQKDKNGFTQYKTYSMTFLGFDFLTEEDQIQLFGILNITLRWDRSYGTVR